jgi:hypothetical protein
MNSMSASIFAVPLLFAALSLAWYIGVLVLLLKIWNKVKHLPG